MDHAGLKIGGRVGFNSLTELERNFTSIDFPIELALPWRYRELWLPMEKDIEQVSGFFRGKDIDILSIHATQGRITEEAFLQWGRLTIELAKGLGVRDITIHPNNVKGRKPEHQESALRYIHENGGKRYFSIETFAGKRRVFTPFELMEREIPMTLDTAHIHDRKTVLQIISKNKHNIRTVHLSAIGEGEHHLPVDDFCVTVLEKLIEARWRGNVILEYLPWHHYRIRDDIWALEDYLIDLTDNWSLRGAAFYRDEYLKTNGEWKIKTTGYDRIFEEMWDRGKDPSLTLLQNMFAPSDE